MSALMNLRIFVVNCMKRQLISKHQEDYCTLHIKEAGTYKDEQEWLTTNQRHGEWSHIGMISELSAAIVLGKDCYFVTERALQYEAGIDLICKGITYQVKTTRINDETFYVNPEHFHTTATHVVLIDNQNANIIIQKVDTLKAAYDEFGAELPSDIFEIKKLSQYNIPKTKC